MIHSRRDHKTKAIAEVLADAELIQHHPHPVPEIDERLWESVTEFCAALDRYAGRIRCGKPRGYARTSRRPPDEKARMRHVYMVPMDLPASVMLGDIANHTSPAGFNIA